MVIVLVVLLFGGAAIPKLARNLGSAKNQFEKGLEEGKGEDGRDDLRRRRRRHLDRGEGAGRLTPRPAPAAPTTLGGHAI